MPVLQVKKCRSPSDTAEHLVWQMSGNSDDAPDYIITVRWAIEGVCLPFIGCLGIGGELHHFITIKYLRNYQNQNYEEYLWTNLIDSLIIRVILCD